MSLEELKKWNEECGGKLDKLVRFAELTSGETAVPFKRAVIANSLDEVEGPWTSCESETELEDGKKLFVLINDNF